MAARKTSTAAPMDPQEEIVRLLAIQIRRGAASQNEAIVEMGRAGFPPNRIGQLLGTTTDTAYQAIAKTQKAAGLKGKVKTSTSKGKASGRKPASS